MIKKKKQVSSDAKEKVDHLKKYEKYYNGGVLNYEDHARLVLNIKSYAKAANVPVNFVYTSGSDKLSEIDIEYLTKYWGTDQFAGAYMIGDEDNDMLFRMYSMTGVFLRNYVDARIMTLQDIISTLKAGSSIDNDVVLCPNFALKKDQGGHVSTWDCNLIIGWILNRYSEERHTIIYADEKACINFYYGKILLQHIVENFIRLN